MKEELYQGLLTKVWGDSSLPPALLLHPISQLPNTLPMDPLPHQLGTGRQSFKVKALCVVVF